MILRKKNLRNIDREIALRKEDQIAGNIILKENNQHKPVSHVTKSFNDGTKAFVSQKSFLSEESSTVGTKALMEAVEQHHLESKMFEVKMNKVLNENERLLEQVINKDIVNIIMNSTVDNASVNVHECEKCLKLETKLLNKKDFIEKDTYGKLFRSFTTLKKHCISLEVDTQLNQEIFQRENSFSNQSAPSFDQYFELNELKSQSTIEDNGPQKKFEERS
ncbi:hypothetical protein Tco_0001509 [Tanacetum coccineum]